MNLLFLSVWSGFCVAIVLQQFTVLRLLPPQGVTGDEKSYLAHGASQDPYRPRMFLRPPVMHWLARRCYLSGRPVGAFRSAMAVAGIVTAGATLWLAGLVAGAGGMLVCGGVLCLLMERPILNQHLWPDPLLACYLAAIQLLLYAVEDTTICSCLCGLVVAMAAMTRLEQLVLAPGVVLALLARGASPGLLLIAYVTAPVATAYLLWTIHNGVRYGIWLPDDTWLFNLNVMKNEVDNGQRGQSVQKHIQDAVRDWPEDRKTWRVGLLLSLFQKPISFGYKLLHRALSLAGPDTFVRQRLLPPAGKVYVQRPRWIAGLLFVTVPACVTVACLLQFHTPVYPPAFLIPAAFSFAAFCAFHTRTRFRMSLIPALAVWMAWLAGNVTGSIQLNLVTYLSLVAAVAAFVLLLVVVRREALIQSKPS